MRARALLAVTVLAVPASAEKLDDSFKGAFERVFRPNRSYAVVMRDDLPTASVHGAAGNLSMDNYAIDVRAEGWRDSTGFLDNVQVVADRLGRGEVLELDTISYKDNRVDLRYVSVEFHKVMRGDWPSRREYREAVSTAFKFFLPYPKQRRLGPSDMPEILAFISAYVRPFPTVVEARAFSARLLSGAFDDRAARRPPPANDAPRPTSPERKEIKVGMSALQVIEILGKPQKEVTFENTARWTYPDLTVIFENGKVKEVRF
jgi:hypothetical protein